MSRISVLAGALLLGPLSGAFAPALAQTLLPQSTPENLLGEVVALCERGKGCKCSTINTAENLLMVHGIDASVPDGFAGDQRAQTIVIDTGGGQVFRTKEPRGRINAAYGGDGPCEPADPPEMVPLDGLWHWRTLGETVAGCPPMMAQALAAGRLETIQARVQWDGVFDPQRLAAGLPSVAMAEMSPYEWRKLAPGRWLSDNIRSRTCEDGTCVSVALSLTMNLVAPDRINGLLSMRSQVEGAEAAVLAGFGMADCRVRMRYVIDRIAP
jgi:hypothetical protein